MKRKTTTFIIVLALAVSITACGGNTPVAGNDPDTARIEGLEQELAELKEENKELKEENKGLKEQLENSDMAENGQQTVDASERLLKAAMESPETSGVCGANLTWYYQNGVLVITGTGEMTDYSSYKNVPWYDLKDKIGWVIIDDGVTTVGENAFYKCSILSKAEFPDTLTSIKDSAFECCDNYKEITLPNSIVSIGPCAFLGGYDVEEKTIIYNGQIYTEEGFIDLAEKSNIGQSSIFGWEAAAADPAQ